MFDELKDDVKSQVAGILYLALAALMLTGLMFTEQAGEFGTFLNNFLRFMAGDVALILPAIMLVVAFKVMLPKKIRHLRLRLLGILLFLIILMVAAHLNLMDQVHRQVELTGGSIYEESFRLGTEKQGGGVLGALAAIGLYFFFRDIGSYIVLLALTLISFLLVTNLSLTSFFAALGKAFRFFLRLAAGFFRNLKGFYRYLFSLPPKRQAYDHPSREELAAAGEAEIRDEPALKPPQVIIANPPEAREAAPITASPPKKEAAANGNDVGLRDAGIEYQGQMDYFLPPLNLLPRVRGVQDTKQQKTIVERGKIIEKTLASFGVQVKVSGVSTGPTVTRYELQPEVGVKVSKIVSLSDDLALNLATSGVRIEAPIPGKAAVGIEVPNKVISLVYLREVLETEEFRDNPSLLAIGLGKDITGNPVITDLQKMPHLLVAGATGTGKSVCINTIISSILFNANPMEVKFLMIDPKVVELNIYNGIPHLIAPVVNDPKKAALALKNVLREMGRRYQLFAREGVREITRYNQKVQDKGSGEYLPYYVVIIDELADLMMVAPSDVEDAITRLAQMSRAAGIHLVIATQRPSVDVITGVIKANITSRIAFAVSSHTDSRTILDEGGAEKLLGRGDMLFHPVGAPKPFRVQGSFMAETDLQNLVSYIQDQGDGDYSQGLFPDGADLEEFEEDEDELFPEAVQLVVESGQASISILQRRLRIGYTRAARLIDDMEARGIIGTFEGSKAREVLVTADQLHDVLKKKKKSEDGR